MLRSVHIMHLCKDVLYAEKHQRVHTIALHAQLHASVSSTACQNHEHCHAQHSDKDTTVLP